MTLPGFELRGRPHGGSPTYLKTNVVNRSFSRSGW